MGRRCCLVGVWLDVLGAAMCALGLAFLAWWLFGRLLRPIPAGRALVVLPGRREGEGLEQAVRAFVWLRGMGLLNCPIAIANVDLTPAGFELALRLAARWPDVILWPADHLGGYIDKTEL